MPASEQAETDSIDIWFQKIFNEIREIRAALDLKDGFAFFKKHAFSKDEILQFPQFKKIYALTGQVDDVVGRWQASGNIHDSRYRAYHESRMRVERELGDLRADIIARKPTFWENVIAALGALMNFIMDNLPLLPAIILDRLGYRQTAEQIMLNARRKRTAATLDNDDDL